MCCTAAGRIPGVASAITSNASSEEAFLLLVLLDLFLLSLFVRHENSKDDDNDDAILRSCYVACVDVWL